ncbi:hypothetical protein ABZX40_28270 [Streptomyces sp. NPDC004610]|uniref:hypothetical protein n=1 Tax=unclassified Streptomyces TaxID=2593676 RepID=UPI0033BC292A
MTTESIPGPELGQLTDEMPAPGTLTAPQRQGEACVWCAVGADVGDGLRPLAFAGEQPPSACRRCWTIRLRSLRTYAAWREHADTCWFCASSRCAAARPLAAAHTAARAEVTGDPEYCARCRGTLLVTHDNVVPFIREGLSGLYRAYAHTVCPPAYL